MVFGQDIPAATVSTLIKPGVTTVFDDHSTKSRTRVTSKLEKRSPPNVPHSFPSVLRAWPRCPIRSVAQDAHAVV